jgi:hypothetical protein
MKFYLFHLCGYGLFLHKIEQSDRRGVFHNHMWNNINFYFGRVLEQKYREEPVLRWGLSTLITTEEYHRVKIPYGPVWRLCLHGPIKTERKVIDYG